MSSSACANVAIDGFVGAVPLLGDAFDVMWRSNRRNMRLLQEGWRGKIEVGGRSEGQQRHSRSPAISTPRMRLTLDIIRRAYCDTAFLSGDKVDPAERATDD